MLPALCQAVGSVQEQLAGVGAKKSKGTVQHPWGSETIELKVEDVQPCDGNETRDLWRKGEYEFVIVEDRQLQEFAAVDKIRQLAILIVRIRPDANQNRPPVAKPPTNLPRLTQPHPPQVPISS